MLQKQSVYFSTMYTVAGESASSYLPISHRCLHPPFLPLLLLHLSHQAYHPCQVNLFLQVLLSPLGHLLVLAHLEIKSISGQRTLTHGKWVSTPLLKSIHSVEVQNAFTLVVRWLAILHLQYFLLPQQNIKVTAH